jgi:hypothetical protein
MEEYEVRAIPFINCFERYGAGGRGSKKNVFVQICFLDSLSLTLREGFLSIDESHVESRLI